MTHRLSTGTKIIILKPDYDLQTSKKYKSA